MKNLAMKSLVVGALFCILMIEQVQAGPFGVFGRRGCSSGNCGSSYGDASGGGCSSGNCAVPLVQNQEQSIQQQVIAEITQPVKHVSETNSSISEPIDTVRLAKKNISGKNSFVKAFHNRRSNVQSNRTGSMLAQTFK